MEAVGKVELINNSYIASVATRDWGTFEDELLTRYSEPVIQVGGTFSNGTTVFSLTETTRKVKSQSPFRVSFDTGLYGDAGERAVLWMESIQDRLEISVKAFRDYDATTYKGINKIKII